MNLRVARPAETEPGVNPAMVPETRGTWRRFIVLLWRAKLPVVWILALFLVTKYAVDIGLDQAKYSAQIIAGDVSVTAVTLLVVAVLTGWALGTVSGVLAGVIQQIINRNLRRLVWARVVRLPMSFFRDTPPREAVSRITTDTNTMGSFVITTLYPLVVSAYTTYAVAVRLREFDARLALAILALVPVLVLLSWAVGRFQYVTQRNVTVRNAGLTQRLSEYAANLPLIKTFAVTARERQRGNAMIGGLYRAHVRTGLVQSVSTSLFSVVGLVQSVVIILTGIALIDQGDLTTQQWVAFYFYSGSLASIIGGLTGTWDALKGVQGTTARISEIVDAAPEGGGSTPVPAGGSDIVFDRVSFGYGADQVLHDVSHTFPQGQLSVILGPNGGGKSTLLALLQRLYVPTSGEVRLHGLPVERFDLQSYRSAIAGVSQDPALLSGALRENLTLGLTHHVEDRELVDALCFDGDRAFLANLPQGLDTDVGVYGSKLSGGQRHRVALARALLRDAPTIVLDEPTAALDAASNLEVLRELRRATRGRTVLLVAHTPMALAIADQVVVMERGRIVAAGSPEQVGRDSRFVRDAFGGGQQ